MTNLPTETVAAHPRWPLARMGVGVVLHVLVAAIMAVGTRVLLGQDLYTSSLWLAASAVALAGPVLGAMVAGWGHEEGPQLGAVTAAVGAVVLAIITSLRRLTHHQGLPVAGLVAVMAIQVALGVAGGLIARRAGSTG